MQVDGKIEKHERISKKFTVKRKRDKRKENKKIREIIK